MPDISMCSNERCLKRLKCHRYTATPCEFMQSYSDFEAKDCEYLWDNEGYPEEHKHDDKDSVDG